MSFLCPPIFALQKKFGQKKTEKILKTLEQKRNSGLAISSITLAEMEYANENSIYKERNKIALMEFLTIIDIKAFDEKAAQEYGKVKKELKEKKCPIGPFDMLIGAHAKSLHMILVTNNTKEFERISGLRIEDWA